jgi:hypothetical protein
VQLEEILVRAERGMFGFWWEDEVIQGTPATITYGFIAMV